MVRPIFWVALGAAIIIGIIAYVLYTPYFHIVYEEFDNGYYFMECWDGVCKGGYVWN